LLRCLLATRVVSWAPTDPVSLPDLQVETRLSHPRDELDESPGLSAEAAVCRDSAVPGSSHERGPDCHFRATIGRSARHGHRFRTQRTGGLISTEPRINDRIRVPEVRLVGPAGEQVGIVRIEDALRLASEAELDLVEVAPMARPPVAKLMDYGKFKYENAQKARESRRHQSNTVIKEMKLRPKIDSHDYDTKKGHVVRFLKAGDKVKITIMFRGREQSRPELGYNLLKKLAEDVEEFGYVESSPKQDGRNMLMVLGPHKKKMEARADVRAERDRRAAERQADAEAERTEAAASRAKAAAQPAARKRRGPSDNLDPDIDLI
jgi:translation initiation factor IF-3